MEESMTDTWTEGHVPASDLWATGKSMGTMSAEEDLEAWRTTTRALDSLCGMADALMLEPLILALADALGRAREEERRAEDRVTRPEGAELGPREEERLRALMRRSDALSTALAAVEDEETAYPNAKAEYLGVLRDDFRQASEAFSRYRAEVGLPDRPSRKNARKPAQGPTRARHAGRVILRGGPAPNREERHMDPETRAARVLDALESIAAELERLRLLREYELGATVEDEEGSPYVAPVERGS